MVQIEEGLVTPWLSLILTVVLRLDLDPDSACSQQCPLHFQIP